MAYFNGTIGSEVLGMMTDIAVIIPDNGAARLENGEYPVVYLLHGLSDNHSAWARRTQLDVYAEHTGFAIVMPEVQRGFYQNMDYGLPYFTYIREELPKICHKLFRVTNDPAHTYIAGLSMGGYGAMRCALTEPERYAKAACFSAVTDVKRFLFDNPCGMGAAELRSLFGDGVKEDEDLFYLASQDRRFPPILQCCGDEDFLVNDNRRFRDHVTALGLDHRYEEWSGVHDWRFWNTAIEKALAFFAEP